MKKNTHASRRKMKASIKRRRNNRFNVTSDTYHNPKDRINDDILISIISQLPLRDAIATGVLSSTWRHLYTHADNLVFPKFVYKRKHPRKEEFSNYLKRIDRTLDLYRDNRALKVFRLETDDCFEGGNLKRWLKFALARRIETVKIQLGYGKRPFLRYALRLSKLIETIDGRPSLPGLKSLKELSLCGVRVTDSDFELLLSSFPLLETLSISRSCGMKNILVAGDGLKLKKLSLCFFYRLESIEIRGMINLIFFECLLSYEYVLRISNAPKLTELNISEIATKIMPTLPSYIRDQLRLLTLDVDPALETPVYELKNVKKLKLRVFMSLENYCVTHQLFPMIDACRSLETLEVEFFVEEESGAVVLGPSKQWPLNLKKLVLSNYMGNKEEVEFARFVINNVATLEEVSVALYHKLTPKKRRRAIKYAEKELRHAETDLLILI